MSWARLDDRFHDNRKMRKLWMTCPQAVGLHVFGITYCAQHETDGLVDVEFVQVTVPVKRDRLRFTGALEAVGVWVPHPEGWTINDYLEFNPARATLQAKRDREAQRRAGSVPAACAQPASSVPSPLRASRPDPSSNSTVAASGDGSGDVNAVWAAYVETRHQVLGARSTPQLTRDRRALVARRLKEWPAADLVDAVKGWQHFPHNRGENERGTPFCDIELLLRDAAHIERFRDKQRGTSSESLHDLAARANAAHGAAA